MPHQDNYESYQAQYTVLGYRIYHFDKVLSTNELAKKIAKCNREERILILAETQTEGKGRLGRSWISPKGGLWCSLILRPEFSAKDVLKLTFVMSSAVANTIQTMFSLGSEVKWPNDVLVNHKKICGILTEASISNQLVEFAVIGVGINANIDLEAFPKKLRGTLTSLKHELGRKINRKALVKTLVQSFERRYKRLQQGEWTALLEEWKSLAMLLKRHVKVSDNAEVFVGQALDVDDDCALIIRLENGTLRKIFAGDITVITKS